MYAVQYKVVLVMPATNSFIERRFSISQFGYIQSKLPRQFYDTSCPNLKTSFLY